MICPRCGVTNAPDRSSCTRCSGSLAAPPARHDQPLPPMPITRRAELAVGRARASGAGHPGDVGARPGPGTTDATSSGPRAAHADQDPGTPGSPGASTDLYLLAADRPTGQPPPPEAAPSPAGPVRGTERPGRMAVGLSGA